MDGKPMQPLEWTVKLLAALGGIVKSMLTGPDGQSWAPGRVMGVVEFGVGQCLVVLAAHDVLSRQPSVSDWCAFFAGVSAFEAAICATAIGLVLGMAPTDSGGRWWGREASPPPPPPNR
jgi:hypothetical protein